ncbi:vitamin K epoxide reductase family protein [Poriferisphaera sp. WC338]|uniref:vitamin K epoxide reductase family protein n=1 Tax=Poriferisphaera sp. WC338 TaxID=3425129 RepID=UPI003D8162CC
MPHQDPKPVIEGRLWTPALLRVLGVLGLGLSSYLLISSISGGGVAGCGAGSGCDEVLQSAWSKVLGLPVVVLAIVVYLVLLGATRHITPRKNSLTTQRRAWRVLVVLAYLLIGAAAYFSVIQIFVLKQLCQYCISAHLIGIAAGLVILLSSFGLKHTSEQIRPSGMRGRSHLVLLGIAAILFMPLPVIQFMLPTETASIRPAISQSIGEGTAREIRYQFGEAGAVSIRPAEYPLIGDVDAPQMLMELFDFTCPHCRLMSRDLKILMQQHPEQIAIVTLPSPLNAACNPLVKKTEPRAENACDLAKLAIAVWVISPSDYPAYFHMLMADEEPPTVEAARKMALQYVDETQLEEAINDPRVDDLIARDVALYGVVGGSLPVLFTGSATIHGYPGEGNLLPLLKKELIEGKTQKEEQTDDVPREDQLDTAAFYQYGRETSHQNITTNSITGCDGCPREQVATETPPSNHLLPNGS